MGAGCVIVWGLWVDDVTGDNNLSFIETSALDASNVELAFQNILTGMAFQLHREETIS